jgi:DNA primase
MRNEINADVFLREVLSREWRNQRPHATKIIASSPFGEREDNTPSFYVNIDPDSEYFGCWADKGATRPEWQSGGPVKLFAFLRNITYEEAHQELYSGENTDDGPRQLRVKLPRAGPKPRPSPIDVSAYQVNGEIPYLTGRGISPVIQRLYRSGFDPQKNAVVMPWAAPDGTIVNAKWRATWSKVFWYAKGGAPVREMIYGIDIAYKRLIKRAIIVESETDAMYAASCGIFGLAVGGSAFTDAKAELLRRSPVEELLIGTDNDAAGEKLREEIAQKMRGYCELRDVRVPRPAKDINEIGDAEVVRRICGTAVRRDIFAKL